MKNDLARRRKHPLPPIVLEVARDQIKKLLANAEDREAAQQELEALGISTFVAQSSSPVTESRQTSDIS